MGFVFPLLLVYVDDMHPKILKTITIRESVLCCTNAPRYYAY